MVRRRWLIAQAALLGIVGVLLFPGASSALQPSYTVELTASGPSPTVLSAQVESYIWFHNTDTVAHSIAFSNGWCSAQVEAGDSVMCGSGSTFPGYAGTYPYTVDDTTEASVKVTPMGRAVTLTAKRHGFRLGSMFRLHGTLTVSNPGPPALFGPRMPVMVFARPDNTHRWHRIGVVMAEPLKKPSWNPHSVWHLWVRLRRHATYVAVAISQPKGGTFWERAQSRIFGVYVRR
ncbi:MAG: hypothetical protein QOG85_1870 [Gaiellaceae bacterium]|jgi:hypothetical protein|nr:hypothetical protein [Gaiellaceae bacterium]